MKEWIRFEQRAHDPKMKTDIWRVMPIDGGESVGSVKWYGPWRKYCFHPAAYTLFEEDCLRTIAQFCVNATLTHREALKKAKVAL